MTQKGKCDVCRKRKVKCDENTPQCSRCSKHGWKCSYTYGKLKKYSFVDDRMGDQPAFQVSPSGPSSTVPHQSILTVKTSRPAKSGRGTFQTLVSLPASKVSAVNAVESKRSSRHSREQKPEILCNPSCMATKIAAQLVSMLAPYDIRQSQCALWGSWLALVPARIGSNPVLDAAAMCLLAGIAAYSTKTFNDMKTARSKYVIALKKLRPPVSESPSSCQTDIVIAVKMLSSFEMLLGRRSNAYLLHDHALLNILRARGPDKLEDEVDRGVFYTTYPIEVADSILKGRVSSFDSSDWSDVQPPDSHLTCKGLGYATMVTMRTFIRIPRLMKLVRAACREPADESKFREAVELACILYNDDLEILVSHVLAHGTKLNTTRCSELSLFSLESFEFESFEILEIITRYWTCRIFICGLIQTLFTLASDLPFDLLTIQDEEIRCAMYIAMSTDYALALLPPPQPPLGALLTILPLQISFGAWYRCQKREASGEDLDLYFKATFMKDWTLRMSNEMLGLWDGNRLDRDNLERKSEAFVGADVEPWMEKKIELDIEEDEGSSTSS